MTDRPPLVLHATAIAICTGVAGSMQTALLRVIALEHAAAAMLVAAFP